MFLYPHPQPTRSFSGTWSRSRHLHCNPPKPRAAESNRPQTCKEALTLLVPALFFVCGSMYSMYKCVAWVARRLAMGPVFTVMTVDRQGWSVCLKITLHIYMSTCDPKVDSRPGLIVCLRAVNAGFTPRLPVGTWAECDTFPGCRNHFCGLTQATRSLGCVTLASTRRAHVRLPAVLAAFWCNTVISVCANAELLHVGVGGVSHRWFGQRGRKPLSLTRQVFFSLLSIKNEGHRGGKAVYVATEKQGCQ